MSENKKVELKNIVVLLKKYAVFLPIVFFLPIFIMQPVEKNILLVTTLVIYYFFCFMTPVYLIKHLITKVEINQVLVDFVSFSSVLLMYGFSIFYWVQFYFLEVEHKKVLVVAFIAPFWALLYVLMLIILLGGLGFVYKFIKKNDEADE